ncbi:MAG: SPOR domain-containing protein [Armatimonadota bacterium]|nr:SPOR domain-containing protein [Armatimonadota bacterium]MDR7444763.1 SPOR domain-containing protein [Armatimonadota bacterium]MDR7569235.1 SPOR domain-containing protein [Armatimonadota bacterium]MDR7613353.1 SPOR domain-containing protein [Armatimonadota bacterium]
MRPARMGSKNRPGDTVWVAATLLLILWTPMSGERAVRYYRIQFGPTPDLFRVEAFASLLSRAYGVVGRVGVQTRVTGYRVFSSPLPSRSAAERRAELVRSFGIPSEVVRVGAVYRVRFGTFRTLPEAETRVRQVRRYGFTAVVDPLTERVYTLVVRHVPERVAGEVVRRVRADGFEVRLLPEP